MHSADSQAVQQVSKQIKTAEIYEHLNHKTMVEVHRVISSTSEIASFYEDGKRHLIIAGSQTNGRGRMGRSFYSPPETGLYFSYKFYPDADCDISLITPAIAVFICEAISKQTGLNPGIKWVNDIFVNGKKICGILTQKHHDIFGTSVTVGIGLNITTVSFPAELSGVAGNLGEDIDRNRFITDIINALENYLSSPSCFGIDSYREKLLILGKRITYFLNNEEHTGTAINIDSSCNLIVLNDDGTESVLSSGEITMHKE